MKIGHLKICCTGAWSWDELERLYYMIGYQDNSPSNGYWVTCPIAYTIIMYTKPLAKVALPVLVAPLLLQMHIFFSKQFKMGQTLDSILPILPFLYFDFRPWLLIGWQLCSQPMKSQVWKYFVFSFCRWPGRSLPWGSGSVWGLVPVIIAHQRRRPRPGTIQVSQQSFSDLLMLLNYYVSLNLPQLSQYRNHAACVLVYVQYCITSSDECDINTIESWTKCMGGHFANNTFKSILD